jgi:hypothetical protein
MAAARTLIDMATHCGGAASLDGTEHLEVQPGEPGWMPVDESLPRGPNDVGQLQERPAHFTGSVWETLEASMRAARGVSPEGWRWLQEATRTCAGSGWCFSGLHGPAEVEWYVSRCPIRGDGWQSSVFYAACGIGATMPRPGLCRVSKFQWPIMGISATSARHSFEGLSPWKGDKRTLHFPKHH